MILTAKRPKIAIIALVALFVAAFCVQNAQALDEQFYSSNDILFYDPNACSTGGGAADFNVASSESADKNAETIFKFLISTSFKGLGNKPFNAIQAAGALGNFWQESKFNPGAIESTGEGHGLAQWSYGRKTALFALAKKEGEKWNTMSLQLKMIEKEINASYGKSLLNRDFDNVTTPKKASFIFQKVYEGAGIPNQAARDQAADKYYKKFKGLAPGLALSGGCATHEGSKFAGDDFVIYNQFDPKWAGDPYGSSNIGDAGCGPASMAMIITALNKKKVTPAQTGAYANKRGLYIAGVGSSWKVAPVLAEHWGLKAGNIDNTVAAVNKVLKAGGLVITSGRGASPFTSGGHYITIRGIKPNGKWVIGDSNGSKGQANSKKEWDPEKIMDTANKDNVVEIRDLSP